ncbi:MAG: 4Fe-4S dicluster domain-containing protein, partial [Candidatus Zixiibacteriota bacterium]
SFSSPTLFRLWSELKKTFPKAVFSCYEPVSDERIRSFFAGDDKSFQPLYHFERAQVVLSLDSDFLLTEPDSAVHAAKFAEARHIENPGDHMNRLYVVESGFSVTGGMADHRLRVQSRLIGAFAAALTLELKAQGLRINLPVKFGELYGNHSFDRKWISALAADLVENINKCLIVGGPHLPRPVHELVYMMNIALGGIGETLTFSERQDTLKPSHYDSRIASLAKDGKISSLIILGGNPAYNAPIDWDFAEALKKIEHSVHVSQYLDETSRLTEWHIPQAHNLESWGDARAADGTASIIQPLIAPLFGGRGKVEVLKLLATGREERDYNVVRETWQTILGGGDFENRWRKVLHEGFLDGSASTSVTPAAVLDEISFPTDAAGITNPEIVFRPSPALYDGRFANNGWLQELPDPVTKLAWDNAALISPRTARELNLKNGEITRFEYEDHKLEIPVWILSGQADFSITLPLGYGRTSAGRVGNNVGSNTYAIRRSEAPCIATTSRIYGTGKIYIPANTQDHNSMHGRPIIREATLKKYKANPEFARELVEHPPLKSIYPDHDYSKGYQWGMVIDLNRCIGCGACTIGCQSENNVPIVGRDQVSRGREMHWLRIDRYFTGGIENPRMVHQPVACQHCENAPCESVCPVAATVHDKEGLNNMTYNRCIGTRYCSNNCPYKVRRFNFFNYTGRMSEIVKMAQNPDVTVRSRGIMEKCSFCLQRISRAKLKAKKEGRRVADGEIITACQQACPTKAIQFGNINDIESEVTRWKKIDRNYELLAEFNVRPRNSYLAKISNPNPALISDKPVAG